VLQVPDRFVKALENLHRLDDPSFNELLGAFSRISLSASRDQLTSEIGGFAQSIKPKDLEDLLSLLVSLKSAQEQAEESADFVKDVLTAMSRADSSLQLVGSEGEKFKKRLRALLEADRFSISAKAIGLIGESEHTFCRVRILTDFRSPAATYFAASWSQCARLRRTCSGSSAIVKKAFYTLPIWRSAK
jgi:hypothetical protein